MEHKWSYTYVALVDKPEPDTDRPPDKTDIDTVGQLTRRFLRPVWNALLQYAYLRTGRQGSAFNGDQYDTRVTLSRVRVPVLSVHKTSLHGTTWGPNT